MGTIGVDIPANNYLLKVNNKNTRKKGVKYVQSYQEKY